MTAHLWRGVIGEYAERLPVSASTPVVTLGEGGTPLVHAEHLSELTGCEVHLKVEGANPTGSFKDRGMTVAISKALRGGGDRGHLRVDRQHQRVGRGVRREGRPGVRGARAARADLGGQAGAGDGPRRAAAAGRGRLRRRASGWPASSPTAIPSRWSTPSTPSASRVRRRRRSRSSTSSAARRTCTACPSATPATSPRTGRATSSTRRTGCARTPGCGASRPRAPLRWCTGRPSTTRTPSPPPSGSATRRPGTARSTPARSPRAASTR